jgi:hypothetical protein
MAMSNNALFYQFWATFVAEYDLFQVGISQAVGKMHDATGIFAVS